MMTRQQAINQLKVIAITLKSKGIDISYTNGGDAIYILGYERKRSFSPTPCFEICQSGSDYSINLKVYFDDRVVNWGTKDLEFVQRITSFDDFLSRT